MKKKIYALYIIILLICCSIGCEKATGRKFTTNKISEDNNVTSTPKQQEKETSTPKQQEDTFDLKEAIEMSGGLGINIAGETYDAVYGERGALICRQVEATFDTEAHFLFAFIATENLSGSMILMDAERNIYRTGWNRWFTDECYFISIGDDMFERVPGEYEVPVFINGIENNIFSANSMDLPDKHPDDERYSMINDMERLNNYCDGYAIMKVEYYDYSVGKYESRSKYKYCYFWVDMQGEFSYINEDLFQENSFGSIRHDGEYYSTYEMGPYSEGVFYYGGIFYDFDLNIVLDIRDKGYIPYTHNVVYTPKFVDGICRMIAYKNDNFWIFDINKSGEMVSEPEEFDIWSLNY